MELNFECRHTYNLIEESRIETACGALYQGQDMRFNRTVAVKLVKIPGDTKRERELNYQKAYTEVGAMVSLGEERLPVPSIYDAYYDEETSELYIMMDWIRGETLDHFMTAPERQFIQWMADLCGILSEMEKKHIYHKDIKPSNIMIDSGNRLFLIDFNISISTPNLIEGTAAYKAPEMAPGSRYVGREKVDMFSIGVLMYQYYAKKLPVRGEEYGKNRSRGAFAWDRFIHPKEYNKELNEELDGIICKCMSYDPKARYRDYADLKRCLGSALWRMKRGNGRRNQ